MKSENEMVENPPHYKTGGIETIDYIKAKMNIDEFKGFLKGNVIKYVSRSNFKGNEKEDTMKALWYLKRLSEEIGND